MGTYCIHTSNPIQSNPIHNPIQSNPIQSK